MISELEDIINERAVLAGFEKTEFTNEEQVHSPSGIAYWEAPYASILLYLLKRSEETSISIEIQKAERELDAKLVARETSGTIIDGYLILALPSYDSDEVTKEGWIRDVEQDKKLCRKHVVWLKQDRWIRVERITVLGLMPIANSEELIALPSEDAAANSLIEELTLGSPRAIARKHGALWSEDE
jgi:hypothetical protein